MQFNIAARLLLPWPEYLTQSHFHLPHTNYQNSAYQPQTPSVLSYPVEVIYSRKGRRLWSKGKCWCQYYKGDLAQDTSVKYWGAY